MLFNYPLLPFFAGFTAFTPEVPKLYWNVKSQEQRYFTLCRELHKMICYADMLANHINLLTSDLNATIEDIEDKVNDALDSQNEKVNEALRDQNVKINEELTQLKTYIDDRLESMILSSEIYDVTTGTYRPSDETLRRLYSALAYSNTGNRALVENVASQTVEDLSTQSVFHVGYSERDTIIIDDQLPSTN